MPVSTFKVHTLVVTWVQTSSCLDYCNHLQLTSGFCNLPLIGSPYFSCAHVRYVSHRVVAVIFVKQKSDPAMALLKTLQQLLTLPRLQAYPYTGTWGPIGPDPAQPLPLQLLTFSPHLLSCGHSSPLTLPPSRPTRRCFVYSLPGSLVSDIFMAAPSLPADLISNMSLSKKLPPQTLYKMSTLFPTQAPPLPSPDFVFCVVFLPWTFVIYFILALYCVSYYYLFLRDFLNLSFTAVSPTPKIVLDN